jgi:hypothetical protein
MEVTIRKATKLVSRIDNKLAEFNRVVTQSTTRSVFVHDELLTVTNQLLEANDKYQDALTALQDLYELRVEIRALVGAANAQHKINDRVTKLRGLESMLSVVKQIRRTVTEPVLENEQLRVRLAALAKKASGAQVSVQAWGQREDTDTVTLSTLAQADLDELESFELKYQRAIEDLHDELESINNNTTLELSDVLVASLVSFDVL